MMRLVSRRGAAAIVLGLVLAGPAAIESAAAQSTMPSGGAMPLPPSANDPPPKTATPKKPARAAKAAATRKKTGISEPYGQGNTSYTDRIDTRPARGEMQLEDDPRVKPTMEGGRPGLGMRF